MGLQFASRMTIRSSPSIKTSKDSPCRGWWHLVTVTRSGVRLSLYLVCDRPPVFKPATLYEATQLALYVLGQRSFEVFFGPAQEFLEMVAHEAVQIGKFRIAATVGVGVL